jgi:hypothetical protein
MIRSLLNSCSCSDHEIYQVGEHVDAGHEGGGGGPAAAREDAVEVGDADRPEEGEVDPDEAAEEGRRVGHDVVAELGDEPPEDAHQRRRVEVCREDDLGVEQRRRHGHGQREERHHGVHRRRDHGHRRVLRCGLTDRYG